MKWPFSAIESIVFQANSITAFWPGPEPASMDAALAAVDPQESLVVFHSLPPTAVHQNVAKLQIEAQPLGSGTSWLSTLLNYHLITDKCGSNKFWHHVA
jgi:hypothetical protein